MVKKKNFLPSLKLQSPERDFIPYACHYNEDTILTKNGHLMQTIKITGFSYENIGKEKIDLRDCIRQSIKKHIPDNSFALWIHTIRRKKDLRSQGKYKEYFSKDLNESWNKIHNWQEKYVNELFITVLIAGKDYKFKKASDLSSFIVFAVLKKREKKYLEQNSKKLNKATNSMLADLQEFGAQKLAIFQEDGVYYSGILRFLGKIINLEEKERFLPVEDLSTYLPYCRTAFGTNSLELAVDKKKYFAAMFSVKEYSELSTKLIDQFLQLPQEFILTQTLDFINSSEALATFEYQRDILRVSKDNKFAKVSGIEDIVNSDQGNPTDFGEQQMTIMLIANSIDELKEKCEEAVKVIISFGLLIIKEDIYMEDCYWSQLPGNFTFITRRKLINTTRIGGFASLSNYPAGKLKHNRWGNAVTVFYTANKTPYFFNFHHDNNGHTMIIGPYGTGKTVLLNFLISEARKFHNKLYYLDFFNGSEIFIRSLGGKYDSLSMEAVPSIKFNPLLLSDTEDNRLFLVEFLALLLIDKSEVSGGNYNINDDKRKFLEQCVNQIMKLPDNQRTLSKISPLFSKSSYAKQFSLWCNSGKLSKFFDNDNDSFNPKEHIYGFDVTEIVDKKVILLPIIRYVLHKIEISLSGEPAIIVLDEAWKLIDNPILAGQLCDWLKRMREKNIIVIFASESVEDVQKSKLTTVLTSEIATQIYLPNVDAGKEYMDIFKLSRDEFEMLSKINNNKRHFLLKHGNDSVIAELNLGSLEYIVTVLSSNQYAIEIMNMAIDRAGDDPDKWFPLYKKVIQDVLENNEIDGDDLEETVNADIDRYYNSASEDRQEAAVKRAKKIRDSGVLD